VQRETRIVIEWKVDKNATETEGIQNMKKEKGIENKSLKC